MKKALISIYTLGLMAALPASAQSLFPALQTEILGNNTTLQAQAQSTHSAMDENMTGLNLANPEVSVSYMWGVQTDVPNKTNIELSQTFDFPTLSGAKKRVAQAANNIEEINYRNVRSAVALEVENAIIEYVYRYSLHNLLHERMETRNAILETASTALKKGVITALEYNTIALTNISVANDLDLVEIELISALGELTRLNGGKEVQNLPVEWPVVTLPDSWDTWLETAASISPELRYMQAEEIKAKEEINLRKKEGLPEFSVGYTNELVKGADYHGAAIGFSLPLWGNSGRVKAAKAGLAAAQANTIAAYDQFRATKNNEYRRVQLLKKMADDYEALSAKALADTEKILTTAKEIGAIGELEYLTSKDEYFDYRLRTLEANRDFQLARAALYAPVL